MMTSKSKRDYLKKYLTDDKKSHKKKNKKSKNNEQKRIKIIDDDVNIINNNENCIDDLILTGEDAPQIVGIIDERPPELKVLHEDFQSDGKWKSVPRSNMNADNNKFSNKFDNNYFAENINQTYNTYIDESLREKHRENRDSNEDLSPRRKNENVNRKQQTDRDSIDYLSPKRKETHKNVGSKQRSNRDNSDDMSPKRKRTYADLSPRRQSPRRSRDLEDLSPDRRKNKTLKRQGSNQRNSSISLERNALQERKTLDGKSAGLQDAKSLKQESEKFRKEENELFMNMSNSISGKDAEIAVRNSSIKHRKERKNLNKNPEEEKKKMKLEKEKQDVYSRWSKGLKQIEDYKNKIAEEQYEMSKPLARYSNDADLDEILKKQEREGDPMLEYIRNKDKNKNPNERITPIYRGSFPENRFNIRPGYRWDGVDRSNEYEKRWFEEQSRRKVLQEEAYKYSTEDM